MSEVPKDKDDEIKSWMDKIRKADKKVLRILQWVGLAVGVVFGGSQIERLKSEDTTIRAEVSDDVRAVNVEVQAPRELGVAEILFEKDGAKELLKIGNKLLKTTEDIGTKEKFEAFLKKVVDSGDFSQVGMTGVQLMKDFYNDDPKVRQRAAVALLKESGTAKILKGLLDNQDISHESILLEAGKLEYYGLDEDASAGITGGADCVGRARMIAMRLADLGYEAYVQVITIKDPLDDSFSIGHDRVVVKVDDQLFVIDGGLSELPVSENKGLVEAKLYLMGIKGVEDSGIIYNRKGVAAKMANEEEKWKSGGMPVGELGTQTIGVNSLDSEEIEVPQEVAVEPDDEEQFHIPRETALWVEGLKIAQRDDKPKVFRRFEEAKYRKLIEQYIKDADINGLYDGFFAHTKIMESLGIEYSNLVTLKFNTNAFIPQYGSGNISVDCEKFQGNPNSIDISFTKDSNPQDIIACIKKFNKRIVFTFDGPIPLDTAIESDQDLKGMYLDFAFTVNLQDMKFIEAMKPRGLSLKDPSVEVMRAVEDLFATNPNLRNFNVTVTNAWSEEQVKQLGIVHEKLRAVKQSSGYILIEDESEKFIDLLVKHWPKSLPLNLTIKESGVDKKVLEKFVAATGLNFHTRLDEMNPELVPLYETLYDQGRGSITVRSGEILGIEEVKFLEELLKSRKQGKISFKSHPADVYFGKDKFRLEVNLNFVDVTPEAMAYVKNSLFLPEINGLLNFAKMPLLGSKAKGILEPEDGDIIGTKPVRP